MKEIILIAISFYLGAVAHEKDMSRNCNERGYSASWWYEIDCYKDEEDK